MQTVESTESDPPSDRRSTDRAPENVERVQSATRA